MAWKSRTTVYGSDNSLTSLGFPAEKSTGAAFNRAVKIGQLDAAFRLKPAAGPPLSVEKMMILLLSILALFRAATTRPTDWSSSDSIAAQTILNH
ncbi:Protein of unknown function [Gryllus bimaculatus]|nr:Protein of unknown function [Gryllus bimaculatus]